MTVKDLPENIKLIQLAEECSELAQASLKLVRALEHDTPVSEIEARKHLIEEIADVNVCMLALIDEPSKIAIEAMMRGKATRWEKRLRQKERIYEPKAAHD